MTPCRKLLIFPLPIAGDVPPPSPFFFGRFKRGKRVHDCVGTAFSLSFVLDTSGEVLFFPPFSLRQVVEDGGGSGFPFWTAGFFQPFP